MIKNYINDNRDDVSHATGESQKVMSWRENSRHSKRIGGKSSVQIHECAAGHVRKAHIYASSNLGGFMKTVCQEAAHDNLVADGSIVNLNSDQEVDKDVFMSYL